MFPRTNKRKAISTVLTTMIILVASVVLGTGVVIYGTSLFQTGAQQEAVVTQGTRVWVNATDNLGIGWGASGVRNSGDKLVSVDAIEIRGTAIPFTNWYVDKNQTSVNVDNFQAQFNHTRTTTAGLLKDSNDSGAGVSSRCAADVSADATTLLIDLDALGTKPTLCLTQSSGPISLNPGERLIVYFRIPNGVLSPIDSGSATSVSIFAGKAGAPTSVTVGNP